MHKSIPKVNHIWRNCPHLSNYLQRIEVRLAARALERLLVKIVPLERLTPTAGETRGFHQRCFVFFLICRSCRLLCPYCTRCIRFRFYLCRLCLTAVLYCRRCIRLFYSLWIFCLAFCLAMPCRSELPFPAVSVFVVVSCTFSVGGALCHQTSLSFVVFVFLVYRFHRSCLLLSSNVVVVDASLCTLTARRRNQQFGSVGPNACIITAALPTYEHRAFWVFARVVGRSTVLLECCPCLCPCNCSHEYRAGFLLEQTSARVHLIQHSADFYEMVFVCMRELSLPVVPI